MASGSSGPTVLWNQLKGKKVKGNDGKDLGEIKEVAQHYLRIEKGMVNKDKFWIPKYVADTYDGRNLWLLASSEEILSRYAYGTEPAFSEDEFARNFEAFKSTPQGEKAVYLPDFDQTMRISGERSPSGEDGGIEPPSGYQNIRDPDK